MQTLPDDPGFARHIAACNNARLPGGRQRLWLGAHPVGWVTPQTAQVLTRVLPRHTPLAREDGHLGLPADTDLDALGRALAEAGLCPFRNEPFDIWPDDAPTGSPALGRIDRGTTPVLGLLAVGAHLNGLVRQADELHLWVARRARTKPLDPGKLDHLVAGGVPAGLTPAQTLVKEAGEEAAIPPELAARARQVGEISYAMERPEGLRRDRLVIFDLELPADFQPRPADGEVESFELWPLARAVERVRTTDDFKFNVNLVLIDLFARLGLA